MSDFLNIYKGKKVFVTGLTGFKGSWLNMVLQRLGAEVLGYSLVPEEETLSTYFKDIVPINNIYADIRDYDTLLQSMQEFQPDIVIHMAAQPIVLESYIHPRETFETNVQGTVNVLEAVRHCESVKLLLNVTTDKVYLNENLGNDFVETDKLCGFDPYSNSKSCSELVTFSYYNSFFKDRDMGLATLRAGNVIGGGDFAKFRIVPDCARSLAQNAPIVLRNPTSTRPYQHVLEALFAYLRVGSALYGKNCFDSVNVGPDTDMTTREIATIFCQTWGGNSQWTSVQQENAPAEAKLLRLDTTHLKTTYNWKQILDGKESVEFSVVWYKAWAEKDIDKCLFITKSQIDYFCDYSQ